MANPPYDLVAAARHVSKKDRALARVIREVGPCALEISARQSPYQALVESIVYQQLSGRAAATIYGRLCRSFGSSRCPKPRQVLESTDEQLRGAGLSRSKAAALRDLATHALDDRIPTRTQALRLPDDELIARLTEVRGVGRWTAEMFLIFNLGRPDVLPVDDYGVRKGFARTQGREVLPRPKELTDHGERWRPFRSVASWYLWRACELA
jgi:3-methyladenine DNA glycosylase/8-oxoguanine DNA glycosylase